MRTTQFEAGYFYIILFPILINRIADNVDIPSDLIEIMIDGINIPLRDFKVTAACRSDCLFNMRSESCFVKLRTHA